MRRVFTTLTAAGLLSAALGCCHHVSGVCDCAGPGDACCYGHGPGSFIDAHTYGYGEIVPAPSDVVGHADAAPQTVVTTSAKLVPQAEPMLEPPLLEKQ